MIKKLICLLCALAACFCCCGFARPFPTVFPIPSLSAESAILLEASNGSVFYEKDAHTRMGMASTTKLMTALVAVEQAEPEHLLTIPEEAVGIEGSSVYLVAGEQLTLKELLYALLLSSANDAAIAIAVCVGGSVEGFCALMNEKAAAMGLTDTHFENPHGLFHENHYTTAYELAKIAAEVLSVPLLREITATYKHRIPHDGIPGARLLVNHNKLLRSYEGAIGMKTGFTKKTGRTLVSAAERNGMTLIAVTLNAPDDWRDHTALLDYGFSAYEALTFSEAGEFRYQLPVVGGTESCVTLTNTDPLTLILPKGYASPTVSVEGTSRFLYAPARSGERFGRVILRVGDQTAVSPLRLISSSEQTEKKGSGFFAKLFGKTSE